ncbi:MAG: hypothetical protein FWG61_07175 [Firmicutes bacterium]|nr:hypothetical protein [Bacillota bacterium]
MDALIYSELPDSLAIFSPSKAEELKRSLKLHEATTKQSRRKKGSEDGDEWVFRGAHIYYYISEREKSRVQLMRINRKDDKINLPMTR